MSTYTPRPTSPRPPTFPKGATVAFDFAGMTTTGTFLRRFTPARNAGYHYEIEVDGMAHLIFANGPTGRTVRVVR
jgi:hypothetical protein